MPASGQFAAPLAIVPFVRTADKVDRTQTFSIGCVGAWTLVVFVVSVAAIPVAATWNGRGGEEWWTGLVLGCPWP